MLLAGLLLAAGTGQRNGREWWREGGRQLIQALGEWFLEGLWRQADPLWEKTGRESGGLTLLGQDLPQESRDPAWRRWQRIRRFYAEHAYLAWYGDEETGQGTEERAETDGALSAEASVETLAGALPRPITGKTYIKEQLADYDFLMKNFYSVHTSTTADRQLMNAQVLLGTDLSLEKGQEGPQILIYHTHSQEAFADSGPGETVTALGTRLSELLERRGYSVLHDESVYDLRDGTLDRSKAYSYALEGIMGILQKYPSIQVILDLHRDGVADQVRLVTEVDGKPTARIMFFNGLSQTPEGRIEYLPNPYREENLAFSLQLQLGAEAYFPGFTRKIYLKGLRYNEHLRPRSSLIEVGAQTNTFEEAENAMEPLAELLDMVLQGN